MTAQMLPLYIRNSSRPQSSESARIQNLGILLSDKQEFTITCLDVAHLFTVHARTLWAL